MKEDFLHFVWKYKLLKPVELKTTTSESVEIIDQGQHNQDAGPDFLAAKIRINGTLWAGNVEIHTKSDDWYKHHHDQDETYKNVILHVVFKHNKEVQDIHNNNIPVLEISSYLQDGVYERYELFMVSHTWIPCANYLDQANNLIISNWINRMLIERLESKSNEMIEFHKYFNYDWDKTFYYFLAKSFGFKNNSTPFGILAQRTPLNLLMKHRDNLTVIEALLFGQAGLLEEEFLDAYPSLLKKEYSFLKHKYTLEHMDGSTWMFGKLRPPNFPTIRISQFAQLIHRSGRLFSKLLEAKTVKEIHTILQVKGSPYWDNHYRFDKVSRKTSKNLGESSVDNIIINTVCPLKFIYGRDKMKPGISDSAIDLLTQIPPENNTIVKNWKHTGIKAKNAAESQALIQLKKNYCTLKKCLNCAIGLDLMRKTG